MKDKLFQFLEAKNIDFFIKEANRGGINFFICGDLLKTLCHAIFWLHE